MKTDKATLTESTDARGNVWWTIFRGEEILLETRDRDEADKMATDLDILAVED